MPYTSAERAFFVVLGIGGLSGLNGVFLWAAFARPDVLWAAMSNPVSAAFIVEALVMTGVLAYLLTRWRASRVHWAWFVVLALVGGLAFALPVVLLWSERRPAVSA